MKRFVANEDGQGVVEYALIIMLAMVVLLSAVALVGNNAAAFFRTFTNNNF